MVKGIGGGLLFLIAALLVVGVFGLLRSNLEAQIEGEVWLPLPENFKGLVVDGDRAYFVQARTLPNGGVRVTVGGWHLCVATPNTASEGGWSLDKSEAALVHVGCRAHGGSLQIGPFGPGAKLEEGPPPLPTPPGPKA